MGETGRLYWPVYRIYRLDIDACVTEIFRRFFINPFGANVAYLQLLAEHQSGIIAIYIVINIMHKIGKGLYEDALFKCFDEQRTSDNRRLTMIDHNGSPCFNKFCSA